MVISFPGGRWFGRSAAPGRGIGQGPVRHPILQEVHGYWDGLRQRGHLPLRADIDPRGMENGLAGAFLLERVAPGIARFRLAGMALADLMGMDVRGMPLTAMMDPVARDQIAATVEQVFARPAVADIALEAERGLGRPALSAQMILLPLQAEPGRSAMALGCIVPMGDSGRRPRRFHIAQIITEAARGMVAEPALRQHYSGLSEAAAPMQGAERPYLRLVRSGG